SLAISSLPSVFALASDGRDFLVVALANGGHAIVVTNQGGVIPRAEAIDANQSLANPWLAWNGSRYALAYTRGFFLSHTPPEKRVTLLGSSGEVLVAPFTTPFASPAILAPGNGDVLAVYNANGIEARHIDNAGTISDAVLIRECSFGVTDVAWNGTDYYVVSNVVFRIGGTGSIALPSDAQAFALASGRGAIGIAYVRQQPLVAIGNPIIIFRANWELIPPRRARAVRP
ncbi:MAG TPA: hypothetical protein VMU84_06440, partial [Thermoanaerobaculia bacterium]|nr:hypothetical protein [Thermoanaerobaculia bacterium]